MSARAAPDRAGRTDASRQSGFQHAACRDARGHGDEECLDLAVEVVGRVQDIVRRGRRGVCCAKSGVIVAHGVDEGHEQPLARGITAARSRRLDHAG